MATKSTKYKSEYHINVLKNSTLKLIKIYYNHLIGIL